MLDRRHFLLTSGAAALVASAPLLINATAKAEFDPHHGITDEELRLACNVADAIHDLRLCFFSLHEMTAIFGIVNGAVENVQELRTLLQMMVIDWRARDIAARVSYVNAIFYELRKRHGTNRASYIVWMHHHGYPKHKSKGELMTSGDYFALRSVALELNATLA